MTTTPDDFAANARRADSVLTTAMESWKSGLDSVTSQFRAFPSVGNLPHVDATEAVERQFAFIQQIVDLNHQYARQLAEVANTLTGATRSQLESVGSVVRDQVASISDVARSGADTVEQAAQEQADQVEQAAQDQADQAEQAERQQARDAAKAERAERKEARDKAAERYEGLTKVELSEQAAKRDLPKTATVAALSARLVEDDATADSK